MMPVYLHACLMIAGFVILFSGFLIARYGKRKKWWLKTHKVSGLSGASFTLAGFITIVISISFSGRPHFLQFHDYLGVAATTLAIAMPVLGFMQLKIRGMAPKIRPMHRFIGWIMLMAMFINIIIGINSVV